MSVFSVDYLIRIRNQASKVLKNISKSFQNATRSARAFRRSMEFLSKLKNFNLNEMFNSMRSGFSGATASSNTFGESVSRNTSLMRGLATQTRNFNMSSMSSTAMASSTRARTSGRGLGTYVAMTSMSGGGGRRPPIGGRPIIDAEWSEVNGGGLSRMGQVASGVSAKMDEVRRRIMKLRNTSSQLRSSLIYAGFNTYLFAQPIRSAMEFEESLTDVQKTVDGMSSPQALKEMGEQFKKLSEAIPVARHKLVGIGALGGQLGIKKEDLIQFTSQVSEMAVAFDMKPEIASDYLASIKNVFQLNLKQMMEFGDSINHISNNTNASAAHILEAFNNSGSGAGKAMNMSITDTAVLASAFLQAGQGAQSTGTMMMMMSRQLSRNIGLFGTKIATLYGKDPLQAIRKLLMLLNSIKDPVKRALAFGKVFGRTSANVYRMSQFLIDKTTEKYAKDASKVGSVDKEFAIKLKTAHAQMVLMQNAFRNLSTNIGDSIMPQVRAFFVSIKEGAIWLENFSKKYPVLTHYIYEAVIGFSILSIAVLAFMFVFTQLKVVLLVIELGFLGLFRAIIFLGTVLYANPVTWYILAFLALVAVIVLVIYYFKDIAYFTKWLGYEIVKFFLNIDLGIAIMLDSIINGVTRAKNALKSLFTGKTYVFKASHLTTNVREMKQQAEQKMQGLRNAREARKNASNAKKEAEQNKRLLDGSVLKSAKNPGGLNSKQVSSIVSSSSHLFQSDSDKTSKQNAQNAMKQVSQAIGQQGKQKSTAVNAKISPAETAKFVKNLNGISSKTNVEETAKQAVQAKKTGTDTKGQKEAIGALSKNLSSGLDSAVPLKGMSSKMYSGEVTHHLLVLNVTARQQKDILLENRQLLSQISQEVGGTGKWVNPEPMQIQKDLQVNKTLSEQAKVTSSGIDANSASNESILRVHSKVEIVGLPDYLQTRLIEHSAESYGDTGLMFVGEDYGNS